MLRGGGAPQSVAGWAARGQGRAWECAKADSVSLLLGEQPALPSLGAEMINEQRRRALRMKNILTVPGINHHIMQVP